MRTPWKQVSLAVLLALASPGAAMAGEPGEVTPAQARTRLLEMAETLGRAKAYSVEVHAAYDAIQPSGQKVEFSDERDILVRRPDGLRVEVERSDGDRSLVLFDGKAITAASESENVYAQAEKPGSLDDAVRYFRQDLRMQLPLAAMLLTTFRQEMESRLGAVEYVESTDRFGKETDHFAAQGTDIDAQFWVTVDDPPLPLRIVITYKHADGQPQYAATFEEWDLSPSASDSKFEFEAAKDARRIAFMPQVVAHAAGSAPAAKGTKP